MRKVILEESTHRYYDDLGREYKSATRFLGSFKEPFDAGAIAPYVAKGRKSKFSKEAKSRGVSIEVIQSEQPLYERGYTLEAVLKEWDAKRDAANEKGTFIHNNLEWMLFNNKLPTDLEYKNIYESVWNFMRNKSYYKIFPEVVLHSEEIMIAGTADLRCQRTKNKDSVIDYFDYKTNIIGYDSTSIKDNKVKHYNRFMKYPLEYLEDCEYNKYALQLSLYAFMDQEMFGSKIGKLAILNVVDGFQYIPVPYMRREIEILFKYSKINLEL